MKRVIASALMIVVLITGCGSSNTEASVENAQTSEEVGSSEEPAAEEQDTDKEAIVSFYSDISKAYDWTKAGSGRRNSEIIELTKTAMDSLETMDASGSDYSDYINGMKNNSVYSLFKVAFIENEVGADFDSSFTKSAYSREMGEMLKKLLDVPLPFEYDGQQLADDSAQESEYTYAEIKGILGDYMKDMVSSGVYIQDFMNYYAFPEDKYFEYEVDGYTVRSQYTIDFADLSNLNMAQMFNIYGYTKEPSKVVYKASGKEITIYSSELLNVYLYEYMMCCAGFYSKNYTEETNKQYFAIEELFNQNDDITVCIDDIEFQLQKEDIENARAWFLLFDVIRGYVGD